MFTAGLINVKDDDISAICNSIEVSMPLMIIPTVWYLGHGQIRIFYMPQMYFLQETNFYTVLLRDWTPRSCSGIRTYDLKISFWK